MKPIKVYCANLPHRTKRRKHIESEFKGKPEFELKIIPAFENKADGAIGLYQTFLSILDFEKHQDNPYFIFIEDDHKFTSWYSFSYLKERIIEGNSKNAELLVCGPTFIHLPIQCSDNLFWVKVFNGSQFMVIYRRIFKKYKDIVNNRRRILDMSLSEELDNKYVLFPAISEQEYFGYSDATPHIFENSEHYLRTLSLEVNNRMEVLNELRTNFK